MSSLSSSPNSASSSSSSDLGPELTPQYMQSNCPGLNDQQAASCHELLVRLDHQYLGRVKKFKAKELLQLGFTEDLVAALLKKGKLSDTQW